jgi:hypothetical protein
LLGVIGAFLQYGVQSVNLDSVLASAELEGCAASRAARAALASAPAGVHLLPGLKPRQTAVVCWSKVEKQALLKVVLT